MTRLISEINEVIIELGWFIHLEDHNMFPGTDGHQVKIQEINFLIWFRFGLVYNDWE